MVWLGMILWAVSEATGIPTGPPVTVVSPVEASPLSLQTLKVTAGAGEAVTDGQLVTVNLKIVADGKTLLDTYKTGLPFTFVVGDTTQPIFLSQAVKGLKLNGTRDAIVPWALAGGTNGIPPLLPPKKELRLQVSVVKVEPASSK